MLRRTLLGSSYPGSCIAPVRYRLPIMVSGRVNRTVLRGVVIVVGFGVAAYYFLELYGPSEFDFGGE